MGNHRVGQMFVAGIEHLSSDEIKNIKQENALKLIDKIGKLVIETTSLDAEFDDDTNPNQKLGQLLIKAFYPEKFEEWSILEWFKSEEDADLWWNKVYEPFKDRFGFW